MTRRKIILLMIINLISLTFGQSVAAAAIVDLQGFNTTSSPDFIGSDVDFSVNIYFVGTGPTTGDEITPQTDGSYQIVDPLASNLNLVRLKINITGWTCWGDCADTDLSIEGLQTAPSANITAGQLFIIIDGIIQTVGAGYVGEEGVDVALELGTNVVSLLYMGKDDTGTTFWATDTVVIRIAKSAIDLADPLEYLTAPISLSITDLATSTATISANAAYYDASWPKWTREYQYNVFSDLTLGVDGTNIDSYGTFVLDTTTSFSISGTVNSSGFDGYQNEGQWSATVGQLFLIDAAGIHSLADNPTRVTFFNTAFDSISMQVGEIAKTFVGIATIGEYGRWNSALDGNADHDGMSGSIDNLVKYEASFDYLASAQGGKIFDFQPTSTDTYTTTTTISTSTTETDTEVVIVTSGTTAIVTETSMITSRITETVTKNPTGTTENPSQTSANDLPGYLGIVSVLALGVMTFVIPRFRRELTEGDKK